MVSSSSGRFPPAEAEERLDAEIRSFIGGRDLDLYKMMEYQLGWTDDVGAPDDSAGDRRTHGALALASAMACVGDYEPALKYAVSVELLHNFTLIHGDVQDGNTERTGRPSVWWKWGPSQAINTGDGMHALARLSLFRLHEAGEPPERISKALKIVDTATLALCEGEYLDITYQERPAITVDEFIDMAERRSGSLYGAAAELGSIFVEGVEEGDRLGRLLRRAGVNIGVIKQIVRDFSAFFGEGNRDPAQQGRIIAKKKTLPLAHLFESVSDPGVKRRAGELYLQRVIDPDSIGLLVEFAVEAGSKEFTIAKVKELVSHTRDLIEEAEFSSESTSRLTELAIEISEASTLLDS